MSSLSPRLLPCGESAVLVELDDLEDVMALAAALRTAVRNREPAFAEVSDVVPAARTVLVAVREEGALTPLREALLTLLAGGFGGQEAQRDAPAGHPHRVEIPVHYDGPDLGDIATLTGLPPAEVVLAHTGTSWRVAFGGFAPGFAYLAEGDPRLEVPRRADPRTSVPAGSVALAGRFSAVYPRSSPGGWQLLGRTDVVLFDVARQPPALLQPGDVVCFLDADRPDPR